MTDPGRISNRRVATGADLEEYAYQVAGTVGLMLLPLLGVSEEEDVAAARGPAIALGQAVSLTNLLRHYRTRIQSGE